MEGWSGFGMDRMEEEGIRERDRWMDEELKGEE